MTQDFAKIRPEPLLERKPATPPPAWSLMLTGVLVGLAIGVFASFMFYLSGNLPPLTNAPVAMAATTLPEGVSEPEQVAQQRVNFEFYTALPDYEVQVNAMPVDALPSAQTGTPISTQTGTAETPLSMSVILQSGAFQQQELANTEMRRQQAMGLDVRVKAESTLPGRTLYLIQSGPFRTQGDLASAEQTMRLNNLQTLRISPR